MNNITQISLDKPKSEDNIHNEAEYIVSQKMRKLLSRVERLNYRIRQNNQFLNTQIKSFYFLIRGVNAYKLITLDNGNVKEYMCKHYEEFSISYPKISQIEDENDRGYTRSSPSQALMLMEIKIDALITEQENLYKELTAHNYQI